MKVDELMTTARDMVSVRRVYAEPIEKDGVTVIPTAKVAGGGGGGQGHDEKGQEGEGGGFGAGGRPVGAFTIKDGTVRWVPAVDINRLIATVGAVVIAALFARVRVAKLRAKAAAGKR